MDVMRRVTTRLSAPELPWSAITVTVVDIERAFALEREAEVSGVEEVVDRYGRLGSLSKEQGVKLLYPHPREYFSCGDWMMIIPIRFPQVWALCMNECGVCSEMLRVLMCVLCVYVGSFFFRGGW